MASKSTADKYYEMDNTTTWSQYQAGIDYNQRLNPDLHSTVNKNERFYAGNQWDGVVSNGLPTPVFNLFKRIINYFIAAIMSQKTTLKFSATYSPTETDDTQLSEEEAGAAEAARILTAYSDELMEKTKFDSVLRQTLLDMAISGDGCSYIWFNADKKIGQKSAGEDIMGDIELEVKDNVNVFFGNPNDRRVNANGRPVQPYIIISFRELVVNLRREAIFHGMDEMEANQISSDEDTEYQSGDRGKVELDRHDDVTGKTTALLKMWHDKDTNTIMAIKETKYITIRKKWDTLLSIYPVAWANWDVRKNSYHGQAMGTGLIPNQLYINKMFAMVMLFMQQMAFPKVVYDETKISAYTNQIGAAIPVTGDVNGAVSISYPAQMSGKLLDTIDVTIKYTKDMLGATDAALGEVKPDNTSAIIAVTQQAAIPLENIKQELYKYVDSIGYIWLDMMTAYYGKRKIPIMVNGEKKIVEFDFAKLKDMHMQLKVDVGASSYWSEITAMQTLDNLLQSEKIDFLMYLERIPDGIIPKKQELIDQIKGMQEQQAQMAQQQQEQQTMQQQAQAQQPQQPQQEQQAMQQQAQNEEYEQMKQFVESLPPEIQQIIQQMQPDEMEQHILAMMAMSPEELQQHMQEMMGGV